MEAGGVIGNQAIAAYQTISQLASGSDYPYNGGTSTNLGFTVSRFANPDLKWESTTQLNIGVDAAMFNGRLTATVDAYSKKTSDLLLARQLPRYTGLASIIDNVGSVENKGLELSLSGDILVNEVKWNTGFNISWNKNKVLDIGGVSYLPYATSTGGYGIKNGFMQLRVGEPFGQMYGYGYEGTWKTSEAERAKLYGQLPGDPKYTDLNNDTLVDAKDLKVIGNSMPSYIFGWSNRITFDNLELTVLLQGSVGNDIFNQSRIRLENPSEGTSTALLNRWTPDNQNTDVPAIIDAKTRQAAALKNKISLGSDVNRTSRWVEDGSYYRVKNITLAYNLPKAQISKIGLAKVRTYVSGTNLFTVSKYKGYDPETSAYNGNDAQIGVDLNNYPTAKTVTFGIEVSF